MISTVHCCTNSQTRPNIQCLLCAGDPTKSHNASVRVQILSPELTRETVTVWSLYLGHSVKEWRFLDVGGVFVPRVEDAVGGNELLPGHAPIPDLRVNFAEHRRDHVLAFDFLDLRARRPDFPQKNRLPFSAFAWKLTTTSYGANGIVYKMKLVVLTDRFCLKVDVHPTSDCIGNDE